jgi:glycosyltransferase involved in cell wall biosynthesis
MTICFDVSYVQHRRAGLGRLITELLPALLEQDSENAYILHGWSYSLDVEKLAELKKPNVTTSLAKIPGNVKRWYWTRARFPFLESLIGAFDIFHSADQFLPPLKHAKSVATVHDLASLKFPEFFDQSVLRMNAFLEEHVHRADMIIVPSEHTKHDVIALMSVPSERIHLVRPPVSSTFSAKPKANDAAIAKKFALEKPYILFVGTLEPRKNVAAVIEAFNRLSATTKCELIVVGKKGWMCEPILHAIENSPVNNRIRHLDFVSDDELAVLYRRAMMFVYPSFYEGHGSPVAEAMASGIPIITSANSSLREIADGVALLIDPSKPDEIAEAMHMLLDDEVRRVEMRQRGLHVVEQFSANAAARNVLSIYRSLYETPRR